MLITFADVAATFDAILSGALSREDADRWAWGVIEANDAAALEFLPTKDEDRIWRGVTYLFGIDMPNPEQAGYLHSVEDIRKAYAKIAD